MIQKLQDSRAVLLGSVGIFALGLTTSGYALGDGLRYALYDLRSADEMDPPTQDATFLSFRARNAAAISIPSRRWSP